jgi:uncharacterized protein YlxP (DUF503 family)
MVVAVLTMVIAIPQANSLKEKRRVIKSIKERLKKNFNVSVSEVDRQDVWKSAVLGVAVVSGDSAYANGVISRVQDYVEKSPDAILDECRMEWR